MNTTIERDVFGNPVDPEVGYAWGSILSSYLDEQRSLDHGLWQLGEKVRRGQRVFSLTGVCRYAWIEPGDPRQRTEYPAHARADLGEQAAHEVLRWFGGDPTLHSAKIINRLVTLNWAIIATLSKRGGSFVSLIPCDIPQVRSATHYSSREAARLLGVRMWEVKGVEHFEAITDWSDIDFVMVTPFIDVKLHLTADELRMAVDISRRHGKIIYFDDSHSSLRVSGLGEARGLELGADLAADSTDKHIHGPRGGMVAGRKDLLDKVDLTLTFFGGESHPFHTGAVAEALRKYDVDEVRRCYSLGQRLHADLRSKWGDVVWNAYGGTGFSAGFLSTLAEDRGGKKVRDFVPAEISSAFSRILFEQENLLSLGALSLPTYLAQTRIMVFPDGEEAGLERIEAAVERSFEVLLKAIETPGEVRRLIMGN